MNSGIDSLLHVERKKKSLLNNHKYVSYPNANKGGYGLKIKSVIDLIIILVK